MAAEQLLAAGARVALMDSQRSVGRKFLLAGIGGLNLTHSLGRPQFDTAYREQQDWVSGWLDALDNQALMQWADALGAQTFVGTSGRVFPREKKAAPLLRAWLTRLRAAGLQIHTRHRLTHRTEQGWMFDTPEGIAAWDAPAVVLAMGGGSWPQLGSDGQWQSLFHADELEPLQATNCGMECEWSPVLQSKAGEPIKPVILKWTDQTGRTVERQGECVITPYGLEGSVLYPAVPDLRDAIWRTGKATVHLDLMPHWTTKKVAEVLASRGKHSLTETARKALKLSGGRLHLFNEFYRQSPLEPDALAHAIRNTPITFTGLRPMQEAISTAGGVRREALTDGLMRKQEPGIFCAGEMLDWEAPTGGFLLNACMASGVIAGRAAADYWLTLARQ